MEKLDFQTEFSLRLKQIESMIYKLLPKNPNSEWICDSFGKNGVFASEKQFDTLIAPARYLVENGGKRWRPLLLVLCSEAVCGKSNDAAFALAPLVELAHTASLIHDDIEDNSDERRGKVAAHISFGLDVALNSASWLYFQASTCISSAPIFDTERLILFELFNQELRRLHLGQAMDILWHKNPSLIPTTAEYISMVRNKTGTLVRLAVKTGIVAGGGDEELCKKAGKIAEDIGTGFQILDDVKNLTDGNPGKKRGDDIVEGKKSLPVLLHLLECPNDATELAGLVSRARQEGIESKAVEEAIELLTKSGSIKKAFEEGRKLIETKTAELVNLFGKSRASILIYELFSTLKK